MSRNLPVTLLFLATAFSAGLRAQEDFDEIDKMLDERFNAASERVDQRFEAVHAAVDRAFKGLTRKIERTWGEDTRLPSKRAWVTYSEDLETRLTVDYENAEVVLETLVADAADISRELEAMREFAATMVGASDDELDDRDTLLVEIRQELQAEGLVEVGQTATPETQATPQTEIPWADARADTEAGSETGESTLQNTGALEDKSTSTDMSKQADISMPKDMGTPGGTSTRPDASSAGDTSTPGDTGAQGEANLPESGVARDTDNTPAAESSSMIGQVLGIQAGSIKENDLKVSAVEIDEEAGVSKATVRFQFASDAQARLIEAHLATVREFSDTFEIPVSLVLAIIETESSFNPRAVSPVPAFGLMQLVPRTAGIDAYQHVYGEKRLLSPDYLFREEQNIELGTAYFGLVRDRYLRGIDNPFSRYYCAVAAYNTGVGNVAKTFVGRADLTEAAHQINGMTEQEVFSFLVAELPAQETRDYLLKIVDRVERYRHFDS